MSAFRMVGGPYDGVVRPYPTIQVTDGIAIDRIGVPCYVSEGATGEGYAYYRNNQPYTLTFQRKIASDNGYPLTWSHGYDV